MGYDWLGIAMFVGALVLLSFGFPVAFSLGGVAILFALIGAAVGEFSFSFFAMPSRIFGIMANYTLLAIPFLCQNIFDRDRRYFLRRENENKLINFIALQRSIIVTKLQKSINSQYFAGETR